MTRKLLILSPIFIVLAVAIVLGVFQVTGGSPIPHYAATDPDKSLQDFYTQGQNAAVPNLTQQEPLSVTFLAFGDISLSRNIAATIQAKKDPLYPFHNIVNLLKSTDFNFANLETPFSKSDAFTAKNTLVFNAPKANVAGLKAYNFAVLNLANNHAFDQGKDGIETTAQILNDNGLLHMGTGKTLDEAWAPAIIEKNGIKIGFIGASYSSINDGGQTLNDYVARIEDTQRLTSNVKRLKSTVDFVVATMHAGTEYTPKANQSQVDFAHAAIDAGADIVIGAHPHWVQNKEFYCPKILVSPPGGDVALRDREGSVVDTKDCKWIYYSLGNFIFDQNWSEETQKGLALKITLNKSGIQNSKTPTVNNSASISQIQPSAGLELPVTTIKNIEEIPLQIKENCCPAIEQK